MMDDTTFEDQQSKQRSSILRVYNYYRLLISFLFLYLFVDPNLNRFIGSVNEEMFRQTIIFYVAANILISLATLVVRAEIMSKTAPSLIILIGDIVFLTFLMSASGGVSSGLGNFLIFTVAFGGGLIHGRVSTVLPAIAFILTIYDEFYLFFLDETGVQTFFQAGILGIVYFVVNILFQTLSRQLRLRESEVHNLEEINQLIINRIPLGVVVATNSEQPKLLNQAARRMLQDPNSSALDPANNALPGSLLLRLKEWQQNPAVSTVTFTAFPSGPELHVSFSVLNEPSNNPDTLLFLEDSTELQKQAQQLKLASLGRLSASIAHEIRNPLGAISHAAQLLRESTDLNKGDQRLSEIIQNHCLRMNAVIENVLQMSRRENAEPVLLTMNHWLESFIEEFTAGIPEDVQIDTNCPTEAIEVEFDPIHLSQVLSNLCENGLRYSMKKIGLQKLFLAIGTDEFTGQTYLEVTDFGEGVAEDLVANLFEPFYTTEATGTGLGLYLSKELCEANDARLSYNKASSGGSCFKIIFHSR